MLAVLRELSGTYHFSIDVRDIDLDSELHGRFNTLVPVLYVGEQRVCHHFLDLVALKAALEKHS
ncbi:MAG: glutaredoxin family protein [Gammaproteobacteria bacterium]|nr:glutaredoxin family protein [Gammaproteobacteria bacterium]